MLRTERSRGTFTDSEKKTNKKTKPNRSFNTSHNHEANMTEWGRGVFIPRAAGEVSQTNEERSTGECGEANYPGRDRQRGRKGKQT